jgi:hypothetical protein
MCTLLAKRWCREELKPAFCAQPERRCKAHWTLIPYNILIEIFKGNLILQDRQRQFVTCETSAGAPRNAHFQRLQTSVSFYAYDRLKIFI